MCGELPVRSGRSCGEEIGGAAKAIATPQPDKMGRENVPYSARFLVARDGNLSREKTIIASWNAARCGIYAERCGKHVGQSSTRKSLDFSEIPWMINCKIK